MEEKQNWFGKHWVISILLGIFIFGFFVGLTNKENLTDNILTGDVVQETSSISEIIPEAKEKVNSTLKIYPELSIENKFEIEKVVIEKNQELPPIQEQSCQCVTDLNCKNFSNNNEAQSCYEHCISVTGIDFHKLDGNDKDGLVCESLP